jgi:hypothetical protein
VKSASRREFYPIAIAVPHRVLRRSTQSESIRLLVKVKTRATYSIFKMVLNLI